MLTNKFKKRSTIPQIILLTLFFIAAQLTLADQKIKTKSNIKNDGVAASSSSSASSVPAKEVQ